MTKKMIAVLGLLLLFLSGCGKGRMIKFEGAKSIACEGLNKVIGSDVVITIEQATTIIRYKTSNGQEGLIISNNCLIDS